MSTVSTDVDRRRNANVRLKSRRGRDLFRAVQPLMKIYIGFLQILPAAVAHCLLSFFRYTRGFTGLGLRYGILYRLAFSCGPNVSVHDCVFIRHPQCIELGDNVSIHPLCYLDGQGGLRIGSDVSIAHNVSILTFEHDFVQTDVPMKDALCMPKPIVIEDGVWIGAGTRILGGVTVGRGSVVGSGAVVTHDIPPYTVAAGVPARVIRRRNDVS